ncbi:unnamed protein product [Brassica oleracea var. botrytis]
MTTTFTKARAIISQASQLHLSIYFVSVGNDEENLFCSGFLLCFKS